MKDLSKQLVHMDSPYLCKWIDGQRVIVNTENGKQVGTVIDSNEFRLMMIRRAEIIRDINGKVASRDTH